MKKLLLLLLLGAVSFALADVPTCPYCESSKKVRSFELRSEDIIKALDESRDTPINYSNCYVCRDCFAKYIDGIWYSNEEWGNITNIILEERIGSEYQNRIASLKKEYGWTQKRAERVANGNIYIGDTTEIVLEAWGHPEDINRTTTRYGTSEQWVYGLGCYVYFKDGKVTAIQD